MFELTPSQEALFKRAMAVMDIHDSGNLLWDSPKLSSWYAVGLLQRGQWADVLDANRLLRTVLRAQYKDAGEETYGTFPSQASVCEPRSGSPHCPLIYETFDPNNALFFTMACMIITVRYHAFIDPDPLPDIRQAMVTAMKGDSRRQGGVNGDNLYPAYSNAWYMRCVCASYVATMTSDTRLYELAESWAKEAIALFNRHHTLSEYNSGTYTGVTMFALSLSQFLDPASSLAIHGPRLIASIWSQTAEIYNPSLLTLSPPFDRTYGFDMQKYSSPLGSAIAGILPDTSPVPLPLSLLECDHRGDIAMIPMQMLTLAYASSHLSPETYDRFTRLYSRHSYSTSAFSPPFDQSPRRYTFWLEEGLSAGGISFDNALPGGACVNTEAFAPGVLIWDTGARRERMPRLGWISYRPTQACCSIIAGDGHLSFDYPDSVFPSTETGPEYITLDMSSFPGFMLTEDVVRDGKIALPGLTVELHGSAHREGLISVTYGEGVHDLFRYSIRFEVPSREVRQASGEHLLVLRWTR